MLRVMHMAGLKKKKVEVCSVPNRLEDRQPEFDTYIVALDWQLHDILE